MHRFCGDRSTWEDAVTKNRWIIPAAFASLAPCAALASPPDSPPAPAPTAPRITLPAGAKLVATAEVDDVRAFPEQRSSKAKAPPEAVVGVHAVDRVYETGRAYPDVVRFFDQQAAQSGNTQLERDATQTSTAWSIRLPQGEIVNVITRNTQPATIEMISGTGVAAEVAPAGR